MRDKWLRERLKEAYHIDETEHHTPWINPISILSPDDHTQEIVQLLLDHLGLKFVKDTQGRLIKVKK